MPLPPTGASLPRVFFYHGASNKLLSACRLLAGAAAQGKPVTVYSTSPALLDALDTLLWTFDPTRFVPHCRADSPLATDTPILLTNQLHQKGLPERIMNLDKDIPPAFEQLHTLIEVVSTEDDDRLPARHRFKHYKERGCAVEAIDLSAPKVNP